MLPQVSWSVLSVGACSLLPHIESQEYLSKHVYMLKPCLDMMKGSYYEAKYKVNNSPSFLGF